MTEFREVYSFLDYETGSFYVTEDEMIEFPSDRALFSYLSLTHLTFWHEKKWKYTEDDIEFAIVTLFSSPITVVFSYNNPNELKVNPDLLFNWAYQAYQYMNETGWMEIKFFPDSDMRKLYYRIKKET
jgi:hypothetical protein